MLEKLIIDSIKIIPILDKNGYKISIGEDFSQTIKDNKIIELINNKYDHSLLIEKEHLNNIPEDLLETISTHSKIKELSKDKDIFITYFFEYILFIPYKLTILSFIIDRKEEMFYKTITSIIDKDYK